MSEQVPFHRDMTTKENPYQSPNSAPALLNDDPSPPRRTGATRFWFVGWLLAYLYPVWLLGSFYLTWLIAWIQLGHRPRPMLDDPKSIGGVLDIAYYIPGILLMFMPVLAPVGLAASFFFPVNTRRELRYGWGPALAIVYIVLCVTALLTLRADPGRVVEWWFD